MYLQHCLSFPNLRFFFSDIHYNTIYKPCHYTRGVNFMYLLQCLKVFLTDSFRLRDEVHRPQQCIIPFPI